MLSTKMSPETQDELLQVLFDYDIQPKYGDTFETLVTVLEKAVPNA
jgi:hypothetical protein